MHLKKTIYNGSVKSIKIDEATIDKMADHIVGRRLAMNWEYLLDADRDGKVTLRDFIHRIKNVAGADTRHKINPELTTTTTRGVY